MATKAVAAAALDWTRIYGSLNLGKETVAALQEFRKRAYEAQRVHAALSSQPTTVDFAHYRAVLRNKAVVDECEKIMRDFKPKEVDTGAWIKSIESFEGKAVESAQATEKNVDQEVGKLKKTLANIEEARPFEDVTVDDVLAARPEVEKALKTMFSKGKFTVPGYKEKFGNLSLM
ncbi:mitochondrial ATP synthase [Dacryopinax primogenitus]|uniref:ATP synthase subunit d, mitochondrial n=1 Tax=Dacryopinax primogenitus (strain DJM 731) TaxID=1858805 RepID=M5FQB2_DACPD|nr:mitochondrial ATP synthase [Dacryopinax primogenitus]EJT97618.1 mitochondrial ATP synthase [Dacryopinax primogenitus]